MKSIRIRVCKVCLSTRHVFSKKKCQICDGDMKVIDVNELKGLRRDQKIEKIVDEKD